MDNLRDELFEWIYQSVEGKRYRELLRILYDTEFEVMIPLDENRLIDGIELRYKFAESVGIPSLAIRKKFDNSKCSILEMMVGLAVRIEDTIMCDADFGDRTSMWFWMMIKSMELYEETNDRIQLEYVEMVIDRFLNRTYSASGKGGLFTVNDPYKDMTKYEIWHQMNLFFSKLL